MNGASKNSLPAMLAATMCLAFYSTPAGAATEQKRIDDYADTIAIVAKAHKDFEALNSIHEVHDDPVFIELSRNGRKHINDCLVFLRGRGHSPDERMIAILSMLELDAENHVRVAR